MERSTKTATSAVMHCALGGWCQIQPRFSTHHQTFSQRCLHKWEMKRIQAEGKWWGLDVIGIYFLLELFTSFSLWLMLSLAAFELFLVLDPDFLRRFLSWKEFLMVNIREHQVESAKIFIERPRRLRRTYFTRYSVNQTNARRGAS